MPPPCHSANTPGASGAAATSIWVNGRLLLEMDMFPPPKIGALILVPASTAMAPACRIVSTAGKRGVISSAYRSCVIGITVADRKASKNSERRDHHAAKTERRVMPRAGTNHRRRGERTDAAVRVRRRTAAPGARGYAAHRGQPRDPVRRAGPRSGRRHAARRVPPPDLAEAGLGG